MIINQFKEHISFVWQSHGNGLYETLQAFGHQGLMVYRINVRSEVFSVSAVMGDHLQWSQESDSWVGAAYLVWEHLCRFRNTEGEVPYSSFLFRPWETKLNL